MICYILDMTKNLKDLKARYKKEVSVLLAEKTKQPSISEEETTSNQCQVVIPPKTFKPHLSCFLAHGSN